MITDSKHPYTLTRRAPQDNASPTPTPNRQTKCKYCSSSTVYWRETSLGFRLFDSNGERHFCEPMRKQADAKPRETTTERGKLVAALQEEFDKLADAHGHDEFTRSEVDAVFQKAKANALMRFI